MPKQVTRAEVIERFKITHGDTYSYDRFVYTKSLAKSVITCPEHGDFLQSPANHSNGAGCPKCAGRGVDWLSRFRAVHGYTYEYPNFVFTGYKTPVRIVCSVHGAFYQTPDNHYRNRQGCPACKGHKLSVARRLSLGEFIHRANKVHGFRFDYSNVEFANLLTSEVEIRCPLHGIFTQTPVNHLAGKVGCTKCNNTKSRGEDAVAKLMSLFTPVDQRNRTLIKPKELDILLPEKNLAIEYCGEYWHSYEDKESEKKGKSSHYQKYKACEAAGVRLITMYESEWMNHNYAVRRLLRNAAGKSRGKLMARKCDLRKVETKDAREFYERYHPQGGNGGGEHYGLYWKDKLVACMRFTLGANDRGLNKQRMWTLTRYATRITVSGGASRLFKAFVAEHTPKQVKSFSDNRYFGGGMYEQLGFALVEETKPDYAVWHPKLGLLPKSHYQRRVLPMRAKELGMDIQFDPETDPRTEQDITYLLGGRRIYDCGKKRWVWTP